MPAENLPNSDIDHLPDSGGDIHSEDKIGFYSKNRGRTEFIKVIDLLGSPAAAASNFGWVSTGDYDEGDVVLWGEDFFESDEDDNIGNTPSAPGSTHWHVVSKSPSGFVFWQAGIFLDEVVAVFKLVSGTYFMFLLDPAIDRPFSSTDFDAELGAGNWKLVGGSNIVGSSGATDNAIIKADGVGGLTIQASLAKIDDFGGLEVEHIKRFGTAPAIAAGAGAGTAPTISITGSDTAGHIEVTAGTTPGAASDIVTITFNRAFASIPFIILSDAGVNNIVLNGFYKVFTTASTTTFVITSNNALNSGSIYKWDYIVIG